MNEFRLLRSWHVTPNLSISESAVPDRVVVSVGVYHEQYILTRAEFEAVCDLRYAVRYVGEEDA